MSTKLHGKNGMVELSEGILVPWERLAVNNWTLDIKAAADDVTAMDSGGARGFLGGLCEWSGSCSGLWDTSETGNYPPDLGSLSEGMISLELHFDGGAVSPTLEPFTGIAVLTGFKPEVQIDGAIKWTIDFQGTTTITYPYAVV